MKSIIIFFISLLLFSLLFSCISQNSSRFFFDKAYQHVTLGDYQKAVYYYEKAISYNPNSWEIWLEYSSCLRKNKRFQKALQAGWNTLKLNPQCNDAWTNIGNIYLDCQLWQQAYDCFILREKNINEIDKIEQNFLNLGFYQTLYEDYEGAEKSYEHVLKKNPENGLAKIDLGVLHIIKSDINLGRTEIESGIEKLKKTNNNDGARYGESLIQTLISTGTIKNSRPYGKSYQTLPERFLNGLPNNSIEVQIDSVVVRQIDLSSEITLNIITPENWNEITFNNKGVLEISLKTNDNDFVIITPIENLYGGIQNSGLITFTKNTAEKLLRNSKEENYTLQKFESETNYGYYLTLTDKTYNGAEDELKYITSGYMLVGKLPLAFTILTNNNDNNYLSYYVEILKEIKIE